ncbi:MAG: hypothetical protein ACRC13_12470 [Tannerellaceae bacterium]
MKKIICYSLIVMLGASFTQCSDSPKSRRENTSTTIDIEDDISKPISPSTSELQKYIIYLENSGSMFGYVATGGTNFVKVVSDMASLSKMSNKSREYFLINARTTSLGTDITKFNNTLSPMGMNQGDPKDSDLNKMISEVMGKANDSTITVLITDAIYSLSNAKKELIENHLITKGNLTKTEFYKTLCENNLQTVVLKMNSQFKGKYYPAVGKPVVIDQQRPYYIWLFGPAEQISKYFSNEYLENLPGYENMSRFITLDTSTKNNYEIVSYNYAGEFKYIPKKANKEIEFKSKDRHNNFQISIAADFSKIPFPQQFFLDSQNYEIDSNYEIIDIVPASTFNKSPEWATHLITIKAIGSPLGKVSLKLLSKTDNWVSSSSNTDDTNVDESSTFGLEYLINGISNAYQEKQNSKYLTNIIINISR